MWKYVLFISLSLFPISHTPIAMGSMITTLQELPPYAQWGRVAMQETKKKYPDAAIIDYLHIGRETANNVTTEKFKLWLRGKDKEFGVYIDIEFNTDTEEIINITFEETDR